MIHKGIQINETTKNNTHETHTPAISSHYSVSDKKVYYREGDCWVGCGARQSHQLELVPQIRLVHNNYVARLFTCSFATP